MIHMSVMDRVRPYIRIARVDHWFKNLLMLFGALLAYFVRPRAAIHALEGTAPLPNGDPFGMIGGIESVIGATPTAAVLLLLVFLATSLVASSNYTLNELLDAPTDRLHPTKHLRPAARGEIKTSIAMLQWFVLACVGIALAYAIHDYIAIAVGSLWAMGIVYNVEPIRSKDVPILDVLSEAVNNPIRLLIGWLTLIPDQVPPLSLMIAYWMAGAFFMATKRFAEYRYIGDPAVASSYRRSFQHYSENSLLISMFYYAMAAALFTGVFIVRYRLELILGIPLIAGFFAYYLRLGLKPDSPVQSPEKLWREPSFVIYAGVCGAAFLLLMVVGIPALYDAFNVELSAAPPLWIIGGE